jgi:hypothetical protein
MHEREWRGIHWLRASFEEAPNFDPPFLITLKACRADRRSNPTPNNIRLERLNHQIDFRRFEAGRLDLEIERDVRKLFENKANMSAFA